MQLTFFLLNNYVMIHLKNVEYLCIAKAKNGKIDF